LNQLLWVYPFLAVHLTYLSFRGFPKTSPSCELSSKFHTIPFHNTKYAILSIMATATQPTSPPLSVKVNVRLCGSVPRQEMEALSLTKCAQLVLQSSHELHTSSYLAEHNASLHDLAGLGSTVHTIEDKDSVASQVCSQLCNMQRQQQYSQPAFAEPRRVSPTFEAPTWAVPARGESRLEVSMERFSPCDYSFLVS
jgi:hypothetical protein